MASTTFEKPLDNDVSAISTNLGSPSSASAVTGADAFSKINTLNSKFTISRGTLATGITYQLINKMLMLYINGITVSQSSGWTDLADYSSLGTTYYSAHTSAMSGQDLRASSGKLSYRGSAGEIYGSIMIIIT